MRVVDPGLRLTPLGRRWVGNALIVGGMVLLLTAGAPLAVLAGAGLLALGARVRGCDDC